MAKSSSSKKKSKERKRSLSDIEETELDKKMDFDTTEHIKDPANKDTEKVSKDKKKKKKKKKYSKSKDENVDDVDVAVTDETTGSTDEQETAPPTKEDDETASPPLSEKQQARKRKRDERKRLMERIPKVDPETGLSFTKQQMRRMCKRVAKGLNPLETPQEKHARQQEEAQLKQQEEALYHDDANDNDNDDNEDDDQNDAEDGNEGPSNDSDDEDEEETPSTNNTNNKPSESSTIAPKEQHQQRPTKKRRIKAVPDDYTCMACQNKHTPRHWIYDCPSKVTMRGTNQVSAKHKGLADPDARKVFVSGLPFDATKAQVSQMFASAGRVNSCKLLTFADTKRCKGQAILAFDTLQAAQKALALSGTTIDADASATDASQDSTSTKPRKELKLKVTKVLNRAVTKKNKLHKQQPQHR